MAVAADVVHADDRSGTGLPSPTSAAHLRPQLLSALSGRGPSRATQLLAAGMRLSVRSDGSVAATGVAVLPAPPLSLTPLAAKRFVDCPLAQQLRGAVRPGSPPQDGFLTMDAARSLLALHANDAVVRMS